MDISQTTKKTDLEVCADMMHSSDPWKVLGFLYEACLDDLLKEYMDVFVAKEKEEIIGFMAVIGYAIAGEPLLEYLCVREDKRNQGIGSKLIQYFEDELYPDAANLYLFASDINEKAMQLYRRLGYQRVAILEDYNLENQTEFFFRKYRRPKLAVKKS